MVPEGCIVGVRVESADERRYLSYLLREEGWLYDKDINAFWPPEGIPWWKKKEYLEELKSLMMAS